MNKIVLAGGTGFIGQYLANKFSHLGFEIIIISRQSNLKDAKYKNIDWDHPENILQAIENSALLINLAGKSVNCRYHEQNRTEILRSRTATTQILGNAVLKCIRPPELWINSSTATIYRHSEDRPMTEDAGEIGKGFSVDVASKWEEAFFSFHPSKTRQVAMRTAIVLGRNGGALTPYINLVKLGLGGQHGDGNQMFSWIHIDDVMNIILFFQKNKDLKGVYNCSSPNPVKNRYFMETLRKRMKVRIGLPSPKWLLEMGAVFINTETELALKSRWVIPEKLLKAGYKFKFERIEDALDEILKLEKAVL